MYIPVIAGLKNDEWLVTDRKTGTVSTSTNIYGWVWNTEVDMPTIRVVFDRALEDLKSGKEGAPTYEDMDNAFANIKKLADKYEAKKAFEQSSALLKIFIDTYLPYEKICQKKCGLETAQLQPEVGVSDPAAEAAAVPKELSDQVVSAGEPTVKIKLSDAEKAEKFKQMLKNRPKDSNVDVRGQLATILKAGRTSAASAAAIDA